MNNASLAVSADQLAGLSGIVAATALGEDAVAVAELVNPDAGDAILQTFDILEALTSGGAGGTGGTGGAN